MLSAHLAMPADADLLIVWFSYKSAAGAVHHDSDYGANYRFGFPCQEITIVKAIITGGPDDSAADRFDLVLAFCG